MSLGETIPAVFIIVYSRFPYFSNRYQANAQYSYNTWSSPTQSNESSNGYFLERSNSARKTLELAVELLPEPEKDEEEGGSEGQESQEEVGETSQGEEQRGDVPDVAQSEFF